MTSVLSLILLVIFLVELIKNKRLVNFQFGAISIPTYLDACINFGNYIEIWETNSYNWNTPVFLNDWASWVSRHFEWESHMNEWVFWVSGYLEWEGILSVWAFFKTWVSGLLVWVGILSEWGSWLSGTSGYLWWWCLLSGCISWVNK